MSNHYFFKDLKTFLSNFKRNIFIFVLLICTKATINLTFSYLHFCSE